jgi:hypothetical protein
LLVHFLSCHGLTGVLDHASVEQVMLRLVPCWGKNLAKAILHLGKIDVHQKFHHKLPNTGASASTKNNHIQHDPSNLFRPLPWSCKERKAKLTIGNRARSPKAIPTWNLDSKIQRCAPFGPDSSPPPRSLEKNRDYPGEQINQESTSQGKHHSGQNGQE